MTETTETVEAGEEGRKAWAGAPRLIRVLEADQPLAGSSCHALAHLDEVTIARGPARTWERVVEGPVRMLHLRVPDRAMSSRHARLIKVNGRWMLEDQGSKNGSLVNGQVCARARLADGDLLEIGRTFFVYRERDELAVREVTTAAELAPATPELCTFVPALARTLDELARVATGRVPILISGESGTGKEMMARAAHRLSGRAGRFVAVNCAALAGGLVDDVLFGHRRGAFTGAVEDRPGLVRTADGGTLFLDEIGDLPPPAQGVLLRVLQEHEVLPLGETRPVAVDLRLVAATHHDLEALASAGRFRRDLLGRVGGHIVRVPPLRERREDMGLLIGALLRRLAPDAGAVTFTQAAARALLLSPWPLNVRALEHGLAASVSLAAGRPVGVEHLPAAVRETQQPPPDVASDLSPSDAQRRERIVELLREHTGNISAVARALDTSRAQIRRWIKRYRITEDPLDHDPAVGES